ncbi:MAG: hypothetical protein QG665_370 [Patescibacteria group bacterium]|nr:hypothetical protein [Patescibacteria group bacterium]
MKNFDRPALATAEEVPESDIARYWKRFNFKFKPPKPGSPAEARLRKACEDYAEFIINPNPHGATGSDGRRRQLHNDITLMTVGEERTGMDVSLAEEIADFACLVATGLRADKAAEEFGQK